MALSSEDILRIAHLARIEITPGEVTEVRKKLDRIFDLIGELRAVDTTGIAATPHAQDLNAPLRQDRLTQTDAHADYDRPAPPVAPDPYPATEVTDSSGEHAQSRN